MPQSVMECQRVSEQLWLLMDADASWVFLTLMESCGYAREVFDALMTTAQLLAMPWRNARICGSGMMMFLMPPKKSYSNIHVFLQLSTSRPGNLQDMLGETLFWNELSICSIASLGSLGWCFSLKCRAFPTWTVCDDSWSCCLSLRPCRNWIHTVIM